MAYSLDNLIRDLDDLVEKERDPRKLISRTSEFLRQLVSTPGSIPETYLKDLNPGASTRSLIHKHPKERFVILAIRWSPGYVTPVHDHGAWGASGVYRNAIRVTNYVRTDDGKDPGLARLSEHSSITAGVGTVTYVLPPNEEIHRIDNPSAEAAVSIHVYGRDIRTCHIFDLETGKVGTLDLSYHNVVV